MACDFKMAIFNYYRTFLNNKLNILLEGLDFRLYWNNDSNLYLTKFILPLMPFEINTKYFSLKFSLYRSSIILDVSGTPLSMKYNKSTNQYHD